MNESQIIEIIKFASGCTSWRKIQSFCSNIGINTSQYFSRQLIKYLHYSSMNKYVKNVPKMYQKCTKNVPENDYFENENKEKVYQKCTKNVPKMYQKIDVLNELWILFLLFSMQNKVNDESKVNNKSKKTISNEAEEVIRYYNEITGYSIRTDPLGIIQARLNDDYTMDDMKLVIKFMWERSKLDEHHKMYYNSAWVRLDTIFRVSKFEYNLNLARKMKG